MWRDLSRRLDFSANAHPQNRKNAPLGKVLSNSGMTLVRARVPFGLRKNDARARAAFRLLKKKDANQIGIQNWSLNMQRKSERAFENSKVFGNY